MFILLKVDNFQSPMPLGPHAVTEPPRVGVTSSPPHY